MNQFFIMHKGSGNPTYIEEYRTEYIDVEDRKNPLACGQKTTKFIYRNKKALKDAYQKYRFQWPDGSTSKLIDLWLQDPDSRECDEVTFNPDCRDLPGEFNLFRGLAIPEHQAIEGDIKVWLEHLETIICCNQQKEFEYMLGWSAHLIQRPGVKMCAVPAMKAGQGAGKGMMVQPLARILGIDHYYQVTNLDYLTGNFQQEKLKTNLLTFIDECTFSGDKKQQGQLKGLITEDTRQLNIKFINPITIRSCTNFIIASNYEQIVLVEKDDRRYLILSVDSRWVGPQTKESELYFNRLRAVDDKAIAHFLYNYDLSNFNPKSIPQTEYQKYQKRINFDTAEEWICTLLTGDGEIPNLYSISDDLIPDDVVVPDHVIPELAIGKSVVVPKKLLIKSYDRQRAVAHKEKFSSERFFQKIYEFFGQIDTKPTIQDKRVPCIKFPPLEVCREMFERKLHYTGWFDQ
jgi:hypothetical protein